MSWEAFTVADRVYGSDALYRTSRVRLSTDHIVMIEDGGDITTNEGRSPSTFIYMSDRDSMRVVGDHDRIAARLNVLWAERRL